MFLRPRVHLMHTDCASAPAKLNTTCICRISSKSPICWFQNFLAVLRGKDWSHVDQTVTNASSTVALLHSTRQGLSQHHCRCLATMSRDIPYTGPNLERCRPTPVWRTLGEVSSACEDLRGVVALLTSSLQTRWLLCRRPQPYTRFRWCERRQAG